MARTIDERWVVHGVLVAQEPLHVGSGEVSAETDLPIAIDGQGRTHVPGTGLAGPMREWVRQQYADLVESMFGSQVEKQEAASHLFVEDAIVLAGSPAVEVWDGVGIDREYGSAASGIKYDRAVLPRGSRLSFELTLEVPGGNVQTWKPVLDGLLTALAAGEIQFGGGVSRGQGTLQLEEDSLRRECHDWSTRAGVLAFLDGKSPMLSGTAALGDAPDAASNHLDIEIYWHPDLPVMTQSATDGDAVDVLPFVTAVGANDVRVALAGAGIKGVLRTRAERIVRTLLGLNPVKDWAELPPEKRHLRQVDVALVNQLFGAARCNDAEGKGKGDDAATGGRSALFVATCYAQHDLRRSAWQAIAEAPPDNDASNRPGATPLLRSIGELAVQPLANTDQPQFEQAFHVAVDRWLGGAAKNLLFSVLEPWGVSWEPIRLRLRQAQLGDDADAALALLLVVLRDLACGRLALGYGINRGFGSLVVDRIEMRGAGLASDAGGITLPGGDLTQMPDAQLSRLQDAWGMWIKQQGRASTMEAAANG